MLKFCLDQWDKNRDHLRRTIANDRAINNYSGYEYLVKLIVDEVLNRENETGYKFDSADITVIDNGDYQGTLLFAIPRSTYQPMENEYLFTYVGYGSCSYCDALQGIRDCLPDNGELPGPQQIDDYMALCKDILCNMVHPFSCGWREEEELFKTVEYKQED